MQGMFLTLIQALLAPVVLISVCGLPVSSLLPGLVLSSALGKARRGRVS